MQSALFFTLESAQNFATNAHFEAVMKAQIVAYKSTCKGNDCLVHLKIDIKEYRTRRRSRMMALCVCKGA